MEAEAWGGQALQALELPSVEVPAVAGPRRISLCIRNGVFLYQYNTNIPLFFFLSYIVYKLRLPCSTDYELNYLDSAGGGEEEPGAEPISFLSFSKYRIPSISSSWAC